MSVSTHESQYSCVLTTQFGNTINSLCNNTQESEGKCENSPQVAMTHIKHESHMNCEVALLITLKGNCSDAFKTDN